MQREEVEVKVHIEIQVEIKTENGNRKWERLEIELTEDKLTGVQVQLDTMMEIYAEGE